MPPRVRQQVFLTNVEHLSNTQGLWDGCFGRTVEGGMGVIWLGFLLVRVLRFLAQIVETFIGDSVHSVPFSLPSARAGLLTLPFAFTPLNPVGYIWLH